MAVITNEGLARVTQVILDDLSHSAVGTDNTAEAVDDAQLGTETDRLAPTATSRQQNQIIIRTFFANANLPAIVEEAGWFMDGSGAADSGEILVRFLTSFTKGSQDLNIVLQLTVERS